MIKVRKKMRQMLTALNKPENCSSTMRIHHPFLVSIQLKWRMCETADVIVVCAAINVNIQL